MKKNAVFLLVVGLLLALAACGSSEPAGNNDAGVSPGSTENVQPEGDTGVSAEEETENGQPTGTPEDASASEPGDVPEGSRILVAYFSATNTTEGIAQKLADGLGADLYEIVPEQPYTEEDLNYNDRSTRATVEQNDADARPAISGSVENMGDYDVVLVGYPIWWGGAPRIINTFVESYDFSGKTLAAFCTSGGSGFGSSDSSLRAAANTATWLDGRRFSANASAEDVLGWANELGIQSAAE